MLAKKERASSGNKASSFTWERLLQSTALNTTEPFVRRGWFAGSETRRRSACENPLNFDCAEVACQRLVLPTFESRL